MSNCTFICQAVDKNCINPASYGEICVGCGACKNKQKELELYKEILQEKHEFNLWAEDPEIIELQKRNIAADIKYFEQKIKNLEKELEVQND